MTTKEKQEFFEALKVFGVSPQEAKELSTMDLFLRICHSFTKRRPR